MRLVHFHVYERHVGDEAQVGAFQMAPEYAVVESWHEKQRRHARLGHAQKAHERAEKTVEEKVKMVYDEVEVFVFEKERLARTTVHQKVPANVPDYDAFE